MAICKFCKKPFDWGRLDDGWQPLVPIADHDGLDRLYQDENGELRAHHSTVCIERGGPSVRITRLPSKIKGTSIAAGGVDTNLAQAIRRPRLGEDLKPDSFTLFPGRKTAKEVADADGVIPDPPTNAQ